MKLLTLTLVSTIFFFGCQSNPAESAEHKQLMAEHEQMEKEHEALAADHEKMDEMHAAMVSEHAALMDAANDSLHTIMEAQQKAVFCWQ